MNRRLLLAALCVALLGLSAGCLNLTGGPVSDERLDADPSEPYAWDQTETVHLTVQEDARFRAVYELNQSEIELFRRDGLGGRNPLSVEAVRYQYPNGTVITGSALVQRGGEVTRTRDVTRVTLPNDAPAGGELAFTAGSTPKRFTLPVFVEGSYELVLPPDRRTDFFLFGSVSPRPTSSRVDDRSRVHFQWDEVTGRSVIVQFYLQRDLTIFGVAALALSLIGVVGLGYYRRQIEALQERREELGLDVDTDDDRRRPPPGMG